MARSFTSPLDDDEKRRRIEQDPDFVNLKRFSYSLQAVLARYPDGVPDNVIAAGLDISEAQVEVRYEQVVVKLRSLVRA